MLTSIGAEFARNMTELWPLPAESSGSVGLYVQGKSFVSQTQTMVKRDPVRLAVVLRTPTAWVDRVKVRVAYQAMDEYGSTMVNRPARVVMTISAPSASAGESRTFTCSTRFTQQQPFRVDYCSATSLPTAYFNEVGEGVASVAVSLYATSSSATALDTQQLGTLTLLAQPTWWDAALRSATVGSSLSAPPGLSGTGGVFMTLPTSPVHAGESFFAYMYADTASLSLVAWRVRLYFSSSLVQYASFAQNAQFNSASSNEASGEVSWLATGIKSTTTNLQVTGSAIYLMRITLSFKSSVAAGTYTGSTLGL